MKLQSYIDGGLTDNLPKHFHGTTITVSPFGGENDICPDDRHKSSSQFDLHNTNVQFSCHNLYRLTRALYPPVNAVLIKMCRDGFNDALKYFYRNCKFICIQCVRKKWNTMSSSSSFSYNVYGDL